MHEPGDEVKGATVLACHVHGETPERREGVILGWLDHKREYVVWSLDSNGEPFNGFYAFDSDKAVTRYMERVNSKLFGYYNKKAPDISFLSANSEGMS